MLSVGEYFPALLVSHTPDDPVTGGQLYIAEYLTHAESNWHDDKMQT